MGVVVITLRSAGLLDGLAGLLFATLLLAAMPTSRLLARRILFNTVIVVGWLPVLWWVRLPVGSVGRVTILLALGSAVLAFWLASARPAARARALLPRVGWADLAILPAALAAAVMASPWLRVSDARGALSMLMIGWDHAAHYGMTAMIRSTGVVVWAAAPPSGDQWAYAHYPEGAHSAGAAMMELLRAGAVGSPADEVELYAFGLGLLALMVATVIAAGLVSVPALRRRPVVAAIVVGVVTAALAWGPAGLLLADGFPNFLLASALLAALPLIVVSSGRWTAPLPLLALGGALVGIAHSWALALTMALPMALALLWPVRRRRAAASRRDWLLVAGIASATAGATVVAVLVIRVQPLEDIVVLGGGITGRSLSETALTALAFLVAVGVLAWTCRARRPADVSRLLVLATGPLTGIAVATWIAHVQLREGGLGYYFWKYALALEILVFVVGGVAAGMVVARSPVLGGRRTSAALGACALIATLVALGAPHPLLADHLPLRASAGMTSRATLVVEYDAPSDETGRLLAAAELAGGLDAPSMYVPINPSGRHGAASTGQWYAALTGQWTEGMNIPIALLSADLAPPRDRQVVDEMLRFDPDLVVVVPPPDAERIRSMVDESMAHRVLTW